MSKDYERIDQLEKDVAFLQDIIFNHMKKLEIVLEDCLDLLKKYEDLIYNGV